MGDFCVWFVDVIVGGGAVNQNICMLFSRFHCFQLSDYETAEFKMIFQLYSLPSYYFNQNYVFNFFSLVFSLTIFSTPCLSQFSHENKH